MENLVAHKTLVLQFHAVGIVPVRIIQDYGSCFDHLSFFDFGGVYEERYFLDGKIEAHVVPPVKHHIFSDFLKTLIITIKLTVLSRSQPSLVVSVLNRDADGSESAIRGLVNVKSVLQRRLPLVDVLGL